MKVLLSSTSTCLLLFRCSHAFRPLSIGVGSSNIRSIRSSIGSGKAFDLTNRLYSSSSTVLKMSQIPFAVIVEAEIQPDRVDELLKIMETNARESRKEPGCLRFGTWWRHNYKRKMMVSS